jgi:hypothetical protein
MLSSFSLRFCLVLGLFTASARCPQAATNPPSWRYSLLSDSRLMDDCLICGRPTIFVPLRGTFTLVEGESNPLFTSYRLEDISFVGGWGTNQDYRISGSGTYRIGGEVAVLQDMILNVTVNGRDLVFTNGEHVVRRQFPLIQTSLSQTQQNLLQFFSIDFFAAPLRELWFSTLRPAALDRSNPSQIGPGDLLSMSGRIVKPNSSLVSRLGIMPAVPHLPIDAVDIARGGEVLFSLNESIFSETLGTIQEGDVLSALGRIVYRNQSLVAPFNPGTQGPDRGLDALAITDVPELQILFSVRSNFFSSYFGVTIQRGDLLVRAPFSDLGGAYRSNQRLLRNFHPAVSRDYGLDALFLWPNGDLWFSTEEGFQDTQLGAISEGDILSEQGYVAFRNPDLLQQFAPKDQTADYGLDALYVVTDLSVAAPPRITHVSATPGAGEVRLQWEGPGHVFQLERAGIVTGPYDPASPIQPDTDFIDRALNQTAPPYGFYRVRQW